jgi:hypothetical protein
MKIDRRALLNGILLAGVAGLSAYADPVSPSSGRLACKAWLDNSNLNLDGRYKLTAVVECVEGISWVYAPIEFGSLGFLFETLDADGRALDTPFGHAQHPFVPQLPLDRHNFVELYAGMLLGAYVEGPVRELFPERGKYTIGVMYQSPVLRTEILTSDTKLKMEATVREDGGIYAPILNVNVQ